MAREPRLGWCGAVGRRRRSSLQCDWSVSSQRDRNRCPERRDIATSRQGDVWLGAGVSLSRAGGSRGGHAALAAVNRQCRRQNAAKRGDKSGGEGRWRRRHRAASVRCLGAPRDAARHAPRLSQAPALSGSGLLRVAVCLRVRVSHSVSASQWFACLRRLCNVSGRSCSTVKL